VSDIIELWRQSGGDRQRYHDLMVEHGYLVPGEREPLPCGWNGPDRPAEPRSPDDWTPEEWASLQADLGELEATDPDVAAAARSYDAMVERLTRRPADGGAE
jgi:hypothetical protein